MGRLVRYIVKGGTHKKAPEFSEAHGFRSGLPLPAHARSFHNDD
jgi:hypothetical protein